MIKKNNTIYTNNSTPINLHSVSVNTNSKIDSDIIELEKNFEFSEFHRERVSTLLENDESLREDMNHLVIAASVMLSDAAEMKSGGLKAYEMGDKIVIEENKNDGWQVVRTIGIQVAQILAHARAKKRVKELEDLIGGIGKDSAGNVDRITDPWPLDNGGGNSHYHPGTSDTIWSYRERNKDNNVFKTSESHITNDVVQEMMTEDIEELKEGNISVKNGSIKLRDLE